MRSPFSFEFDLEIKGLFALEGIN